MKRAVGLVLVILGISLFLLSFVNVSRTNTVIDTAFTVEAGEKYGPMDGRTETRYHPPTDCVLKGKVSVEGEGIFVTVWPWTEIVNVSVHGDFNFTIDPAWGWDHIYLFTFDNTVGDAESHVEFVLEETWTGKPLELFALSLGLPEVIRVLFPWLGVFFLACLLPVGLILIVWDLIQRRRNRTAFTK